MYNMNPCDEVIRIINQWKPKPKEKYPDEARYRDELVEFIRNEFKKSQQKPFGSKEHTILTEKGREHADIEIDRTLGIELKRNLKGKNGVEDLIGRMDGYEREYPCIITVLCGEMKEETAEEARERIMYRFGRRGFGRKTAVIRKDEAALEKAKKTQPTPFSPKIF